LQAEVVAASRSREAAEQKVTEFLSSPGSEKALGAMGIDRAQVTRAVATLSDQEVARLAARTQQAQSDFAAGALTDRDLLLILVGVAVIILIIVAVD
jgi:hypothetical protein